MALKPSSFIRNPLLLALLLAASIPAAAFFFCSGAACPAKSQSNVERTELAKVHVDASNQIATLEAKRVKVEAKSQKGWLGVRIQTLTPKRAAYAGVETKRGVLILETQKNMPAHNAGFQAYDVVTHFNGQAVATNCQLKRRVMSTQAGTRVPVRVIRDGVPVTLFPTLTNSPMPNSNCRTGCGK